MHPKIKPEQTNISRSFDPGYGVAPFDVLVDECPAETVYPAADFRTEWGPIFHRGRLDGSAKVLVIGQDPAVEETITRRILVGIAGKRTQGFLAKLGFMTSYAMINTFVYSVYGQWAGDKHATDQGIATYRHRWIDAIVHEGSVEAIVALGSLADTAFTIWRSTTAVGKSWSGAYAHVTHPTHPESAANSKTSLATLTAALLENWNAALTLLRPQIRASDVIPVPNTTYGSVWQSTDLVDIPSCDLPPGIPPWMRNLSGWGERLGTGEAKRRTIRLVVPAEISV